MKPVRWKYRIPLSPRGKGAVVSPEIETLMEYDELSRGKRWQGSGGLA